MGRRKTMVRRIAVNCGSILLGATLLSIPLGCKTAPAPDAGFLKEPEKMAPQKERFPFDRVWVKPGVQKEDYDYIVLAPVNTDYLMENTGWKAANPGNKDLEESALKLAQYTEEKFCEAFQKDERPGLKLASSPGPRTVVLELAIVELVPSKATMGALRLAAPALGPAGIAVGGGAAAAGGRPSVAIEGRLKDGVTGETLFMFADRKEAQMRIIDLKAVTWWGHAKDIINDWARECVELVKTPKDYQVKERGFFTLKPW
ncbi:permease MlaE [Candidatus Brocadia pituitae]|nr:permease MlaE [Candidatus Brocadia pituitae]